jgi:hypothetical protein
MDRWGWQYGSKRLGMVYWNTCIFQISTLGINYSSESESWSSHTDMLLHVFARHSVQATEHSRPCFLQLQRFESQFVLHLPCTECRANTCSNISVCDDQDSDSDE